MNGGVARRAGTVLALMGVVLALWFLLGDAARAGVGMLYAIPVALTSAWFGLQWGLVAAAAAAVLYVISAAVVGVDHLAVAAAVRSVVYIVAAAGGGLLGERSARLDAARRELETVRAALAPTSSLDVPDVDIATAFLPAEHGFSGDFFLVTNGPGKRLVAIVGDVVGHGLQAAQLATFVRSKLAAYAAHSADPAGLLSLVNQDLLARGGKPSEFVTAACVVYDRALRQLCWAAAGHPPPVRLLDGSEMLAARHSLPLGIDPALVLRTRTIALAGERDGVLLYTDGLVEARRAGAELFGFERLRSRVRELIERPAADIVAELQQAVLDYSHGHLRDDVCLLVLRPGPASAVSDA